MKLGINKEVVGTQTSLSVFTTLPIVRRKQVLKKEKRLKVFVLT